MIREYKNDAAIYCPYCNCELEGVAEDNVIPDRTGGESRANDNCWECDRMFTAYRKDTDTVCVSSFEDYEDDYEETSQV